MANRKYQEPEQEKEEPREKWRLKVKSTLYELNWFNADTCSLTKHLYLYSVDDVQYARDKIPDVSDVSISNFSHSRETIYYGNWYYGIWNSLPMDHS